MGRLIELEKNKRYRIIYDTRPEDGKRKQKTETFFAKTKKEADAVLVKREEAVRNGGYVADDAMTISTLSERFMAKKQQKLAPTTADRYRKLLKHYVKPAFGDLKVGSLRQMHLIDAYSKWSSEGRNGRKVSGRSIRHAHDLIRNMLNWALRLELVNRNVATLIDNDDLPRAIKPESKALGEIELRRLLDAAKNPTRWAQQHKTLGSQPWFYPAVAFAAYTGARRGEVLALRWSDLNLNHRTATIRASLCRVDRDFTFKEPKNGKTRQVTLPESLVPIIEAHRAKQDEDRRILGAAYKEDGLVFALADGSPVTPNSFGATFYELVKRAGVTPIRLHDLRDTHASLLAKHGVPLEVVSQRLGHSSIGITAERYLYIYRDRDAAAAEVFERLVS